MVVGLQTGTFVEVWLYQQCCWARVRLEQYHHQDEEDGETEFTVSFQRPHDHYADRRFPFYEDMQEKEEDSGWRYAALLSCHFGSSRSSTPPDAQVPRTR